MRLSETEILAGLKHLNPIVRQQCLHYFEGSNRKQADVALHVQKAVDRFGWVDAFQWNHQVNSFELDGPTLQWALRQFDKRHANEGPSPNTLQSIAWNIAHAPTSVILPELDRILALDEFAHGPMDGPFYLMDRRLELAEVDPEECWRMLESNLREVHKRHDLFRFPSQEFSDAELLVERIADSGMPCAERVLQALENTPSPDAGFETWYIALMIQLAGRLRLEEAAEPIWRYRKFDWEILNEEIQSAMNAIGTPAIARMICDSYLEDSWSDRLSAGCLLQTIHHDEAVDFILPLLEKEVEEDELRYFLANAVISHFDDRGIEPAMQVYYEYPNDPERYSILSQACACALLAGLDLPEVSTWQLKLEKRRNRFMKERALFEDIMPAPVVNEHDFEEGESWDDGPWQDGEDDSSSAPESSEPEEKYEPLPPPEPLIRDALRPGRNEPCPCGSGKKFKKCCLHAKQE